METTISGVPLVCGEQLEEHRHDPSPRSPPRPSLVAGAPDFYAKLSRITEYIRRHPLLYRFARHRWLAAALRRRYLSQPYGDCKDKSTLLISMLQPSESTPTLFCGHQSRYVDPAAPSDIANHMITALNFPGPARPRLKAVAKSKEASGTLSSIPLTSALRSAICAPASRRLWIPCAGASARSSPPGP